MPNTPEYNRAYYDANREHIKQRNKAYADGRRDEISVRNAEYRRSAHYGKPIEWYDWQLAEQGGVCAVCGEPPGEQRLHIDHDHACCPGDGSCGRCVRGILCGPCNRKLGLIENPEWIGNAMSYLASYGGSVFV